MKTHTTFANIAEQLEQAFTIAVHVGTNTPQLAMFSVIEDYDDPEDAVKSFELVASDGFDGYESLHQFDIKHNEYVLLFNDGKQALMRDTDGNAVQIAMFKPEPFNE
jgi:hypothetical protein